MELRNYFAAHSPITLSDAKASLVNDGEGFVSWHDIMKRLARMHFAYADAILGEEKKPLTSETAKEE